jgi:5'(3')-deoxyribonucleotidase
MAQKPVVAVDLDEVLGGFLPSLTRWHNRTFETNFQLEDYQTYSYNDLWGGSIESTVAKVHDFFQAEDFLTGVEPIKYAFETLKQFIDCFDFVVVTSRQTIIRNETIAWLDEHFPGIFSNVLLGNHYDMKSPNPEVNTDSKGNVIKKSKPEMCQSINATLLIDDSVKYASQCATSIEKKEGSMLSVILFGNYGWNADIQDIEHFINKGTVHRAMQWEPDVRILLEKHKKKLAQHL